MKKISSFLPVALLTALLFVPVSAQEKKTGASVGSATKEKSVVEELTELTERGRQSTPPQILAAGKKGEEELRRSGVLDRALNVGDRMPEFELYDARGRLVKSEDLLDKGHLVVVFYRGAWCPFCNLYLRGLQRHLPEIKEQGANLVAISVENPDSSLSVAQKNKLDFTVLSDPNLDVSQKFGIVYQIPKVVNDVILASGFDIAKYNRMERAELPLSATYVISRTGRVHYAFLDPDYKKRAAPEEIIKTLAEINKSSGKAKKKEKMKSN